MSPTIREKTKTTPRGALNPAWSIKETFPNIYYSVVCSEGFTAFSELEISKKMLCSAEQISSVLLYDINHSKILLTHLLEKWK